MGKTVIRTTMAAMLALVVATGAWAGPVKYVGVKKCAMCHKKPTVGEQYAIWKKTAHAKAWETLATPKAMKLAKKAGVEDPQKDERCAKCHTTAWGEDPANLGTKFKVEDGVGCESCHGAGGKYAKKKIMKQITSGEIEPASVGLTIPDEKVCVKCHNEDSPVFEGFDYEKAKKKIAHPIPEDRKALYKKG